jgi:D-alanyl-D-alanine carboxypeptidase
MSSAPGSVSGTPMAASPSSIRSRPKKPYLAAKPGTSNHGWGLALDLECGADNYGGIAYEWLATHGPDYGWHNPPWAQADGSKPEPWHWEFDPALMDTPTLEP